MTDSLLAAFETANKQMNESISPSWHGELVKRLAPQVRLAPSVLERIERSVKFQHHLEANRLVAEKVSRDLADMTQTPAVLELERQVRKIVHSASLPNVKVSGNYHAWNSALLLDPKVRKSAEALVRQATYINKPGGLTRALGPKASAVAGLKRYTEADDQGVAHLREDVAVGFVEEAKNTFLTEPESTRQASSLELVEDDLKELESFLLPTPASQAAYEAATRELVFEPLNEIDYLGAKAAVLVSMFLLLVALCLTGQTDKPLEAKDYIEASASAVEVTVAVAFADGYVRRRKLELQTGKTDSRSDLSVGDVDGGSQSQASKEV